MGRLAEEAKKRKISSQRACNSCGRVAPTKTYEIELKRSMRAKSKQRHPLLYKLSQMAGGIKVAPKFMAHLCYSCAPIKDRFGKSRHIKRSDIKFLRRPWLND